MIYKLFSIFFIFCIATSFAQTDSVKTFDPKEEIAFDGKRYRVYNNWLSLGAGAGYNQHWRNDEKDEKNLAVDYSFHIKEQYFRLGAFMSGRDFTAANNYNFHLQIGLRKETSKYNLSAFAGPSYSYFKRPLSDSTEYGLNNILNKIYTEFGGYACVEAIYKIKYDVGIGGQVFCDYNKTQIVYGVRLVAYFSSAFRGVKYGRTIPKK